MAGYEDWLNQMVNKIDAEQKHEQICRQCDNNVVIAKINGDSRAVEEEMRKIKMMADLERAIYK